MLFLSSEMSTIVDGRQPTTSKTKCVVLEAVMMRAGEQAGELINDTCDLSATEYAAQASLPKSINTDNGVSSVVSVVTAALSREIKTA